MESRFFRAAVHGGGTPLLAERYLAVFYENLERLA
jgi:hypothetical protein